MRSPFKRLGHSGRSLGIELTSRTCEIARLEVAPVAAGCHPENDSGVVGPDTRYAWNGDVALAYQIFGDGPTDLVYLQGWISNVELNWESPYLARFLRGLASLGRLVMSDRPHRASLP
jgi:hypothetical protein